MLLLITVGVVLGFTVSNATGASFLGCSCPGFGAPPKPLKMGAAAAPAVWPKLKVELPLKKDVAGLGVVSLAPLDAALIVAVVAVVAVVFTNGLLWLKLKDAVVGSGVEAGAAKLATSIGAAGFDAVGLANAVAACVDL